jgi:hypothetical protein
METSNTPFRVFNFAKEEPIPSYTKNTRQNFVEWGTNNELPQYLLDLYSYRGSGVHKAIINRKVAMIAGQGFANVTDEELNRLALKVELDYEIYNGFAIEVIYANDGSIAEMNHVPMRMVRRGLPTEEREYDYFWVSTDWTNYRKAEHKPQAIREWNPIVKSGSVLYYYSEYNPASEIYPVPYYSAETNWIELDYEISCFHLNQVKRGYAPQFILNFATGVPTDEEMDDTIRQFRREYEGSSGENIIITFSEGGDQKPELIPISLNDSDQRFIQLNEQLKQSIFIGHQVTSPMLFGLMVPGQLGGRAELQEALSIFQMTYCSPRQRTLEKAFSQITGQQMTLNTYTI